MRYNNGFVLTGSGSDALVSWFTRQHKPKAVTRQKKVRAGFANIQERQSASPLVLYTTIKNQL